MGNLYNKWGSFWPSLFKISIFVHNPLEKYGEHFYSTNTIVLVE